MKQLYMYYILILVIFLILVRNDIIIIYNYLSIKSVNINNKKIQSIWAKLNNISRKYGIVTGNSSYVPNKMSSIFKFFKNKKYNINNIAEIGFNAGHSAAVFLVLFPKAKITIFDINEHKYTQECFDYLDNLFPNRLSLIIGDSTKTVPKNRNNKYNLVHIDGGHFGDIPYLDLKNTYNYLLKNNGTTYFIMDDTVYQNSIILNIGLSKCRNVFNKYVNDHDNIKIIKVVNGSTICSVKK